MVEKVVEIRDLVVKYGNNTALDGVSLDVEKGDVLGIIGPNGGGKTTLLNAMLGNVKIASGSVKLFGTELGKFRDHHKIGYVSQHAIQFDPLFPATVEEIVRLGCITRNRLGRRLSSDDKRAVREAMELVGIDNVRGKKISELSGGQKQRIFIAKALVREPELIILDEAASGLDVGIQDRFVKLLRKLRDERGVTVITVSHDISSVMCQANKLAIVNRKLEFTEITEGTDPHQAMRDAYGEHFTFVFHHERDGCVGHNHG
ncbi:metal ABC transporter ATP-binding protein [Methanomassiliicoccus luminyensis]|jgi:zinc transport system ATP-binding protein|uniref:metal ABC transporter ATP-binding protein n=1 Tax=Methanomassiliicoccus luminyensis TaxID=1080712 RepID=UPI00035DC4C7|nr:metal ABC transporter ATP-binding protein [Methanomassiliicoccus luminyensis]